MRKRKRKSKIQTVFLALAFAIAAFAFVDIPLFSGWYGSDGIILDKGWQVEFEGVEKTVDLPYQEIVKTEGTLRMQKALFLDNPENLALVMPHVSGSSYEIYINGEYIGGIGKIGNSTANIWNSVFSYELRNAKKGQNNLEIIIYSHYDLGFRVFPYVTDYDTAARYVYMGKFMREDMLIFASGVSMAFGIVLLISFLIGKKKEKILLYAAAIGFMVFLVAIDCAFTIGYRDFTFMLFIKKMRFFFLFCITNFLTLILYQSRKRPVKGLTSLVYLISLASFVPILVSQSFYQWHNTMAIPYTGQTVLAIIMLWLVFSAKEYNTANISITFVVVFTITQGAMSQLFGLNVPNPLQYSVILIALMTGAIYTTRIKKLIDQTAYLEDASVRDSLTGMFNRRIIEELSIMSNDCMVVLDIDNFKNVNDRYGHDAGDKLLVDLCLHLSGVIRETDYIIRLGGDEFCVIFKSCPIIMADKRMISVVRSFSEKYSHLDIGISYGITMYRKTFDNTLKSADALMYTMKEKNKSLRKS